MESVARHLTISAIAACALIHVGFGVFGIEEILHQVGDGIGEAFGITESFSHAAHGHEAVDGADFTPDYPWLEPSPS